ncbi:uncharacterized protein LOC142228730 [Haematobia irritans]|uniref:uncharacterized protein LOC142228730 n=1 Tax=Haematobia irritans TaxID=7368 RepID=UPI003F509F19
MNSVKLIEAVKKHPNIYKNIGDGRNECSKEWQMVVKDLQKAINREVQVEEIQDQWNGMCSAYVEYLRGNQDISHDSWIPKHMDFLQPYLFSMIDDHIDENELANILTDEGVDGPAIDSDERNQPEEKENVDTSPKESLEDIIIKHNLMQSLDEQIETPIRKSDINISESEKETKGAVVAPVKKVPEEKILPESRTQSAQNDSSFSNLSSLELIFLGYAKQLQKMPLRLQLKTKRKIADIMEDAELAMMEEGL